MEKQAWHYKVFKAWSERVYNETLGRDNLMNDGKIHHQDEFFAVQNGYTTVYNDILDEDKFYFKMVKGNENYIVPKKFKDDLPINPTEWVDVKLKEKDTKLWKFVTSADSMDVPARETIGAGYLNFLNIWNPMIHDDARSWLFMKVVANTEGVKLGLCSGVGSGKNANLILMRYMRRSVSPKTVTPTKSKFYYTIYHNQHINIDEITSWTKTDVNLIEDLCVAIADEDPELDKFSMDNTKMMKSDLTNKSLTFTFNPLTKKNKHTFESRFRNADKILDRYPIFLLDGRIIDTEMKTPNSKQVKLLLDENFGDLCKIASEEHFWRKNYHKYLHNWDYVLCPFKTTRHLNNMRPILEKLDVLSQTQQDFNEWMLWLKEKTENYLKMVSHEIGISSIEPNVLEEYVE